MYEFGVHVKDDNITFYFPFNPEFVSLTSCKELNCDVEQKIVLEVKCLKTIMNELQHVNIDLLKLDIEGIECEVLLDLC